MLEFAPPLGSSSSNTASHDSRLGRRTRPRSVGRPRRARRRASRAPGTSRRAARSRPPAPTSAWTSASLQVLDPPTKATSTSRHQPPCTVSANSASQCRHAVVGQPPSTQPTSSIAREPLIVIRRVIEQVGRSRFGDPTTSSRTPRPLRRAAQAANHSDRGSDSIYSRLACDPAPSSSSSLVTLSSRPRLRGESRPRICHVLADDVRRQGVQLPRTRTISVAGPRRRHQHEHQPGRPKRRTAARSSLRRGRAAQMTSPRPRSRSSRHREHDHKVLGTSRRPGPERRRHDRSRRR